MPVWRLPPTRHFLTVLVVFWFVFLTSAVCALNEGAGASHRPFVIRVYYEEIGDLSRLAAYDLFEYNNLEERYVHAAVSEQELRELRKNGWYVVEEQPQWRDMAPESYYGGYRTVDELYQDMAALNAQLPTLIELVAYGQSYCYTQNGCVTPDGEETNGYKLLAIRLTNEIVPGSSVLTQNGVARGQKPVFFVLANIHGRELTTPEIAMRWLKLLLDEYRRNPDVTWMVDWQEIWIVPTANPDGHWITELDTVDGSPLLHRKNFDRDADDDGANDCNVWPSLSYSQFGVDLNRNHNFAWQAPSSFTSACELTYSGPAPSSEPEVEALQELIRVLFPDRRGPNLDDLAADDTQGILFTLHSYGDMILRPWAFTGDAPPNEAGLKAIGDKLASLSGYRSCRSPECLYFAHGTTDDWAYGELGIPSFTFEIGNAEQGFLPPYAVIDQDQWPDTREAFLYAARISREPYRLVHGPEVKSLEITIDLASKSTVEVLFENDTTASQPVSSAEYSLDHPFWSPLAEPYPMDPGPAQAAQFVFVAEPDTSQLEPGRHAIFVRGLNLAGYHGPTLSAFLNISDRAERVPKSFYIPVVTSQ
jgi:carboxypeptidase T